VFPNMMFCPDFSTLIECAPMFVVGAPRLVVGTLRIFASALSCIQVCGQCSQVLPGAPEGYYISPANALIRGPWDSGPTTLRQSLSLPITNLHIADAIYIT
jgi:hypothetical protein